MFRSKLFKPALLSVSLLTIMAGAAIAPALGQIGLAFPQADPTLIKMITTLPSLVIIIASLTAGQLTRVVSRRKLMIVGLVLYLIGGIGGGFATSVAMLLGFRAVLGLGVGLIGPLSVSLIADFFAGETRARYMGYSTAVSNLGGVITTIVAGWLAVMNWRYPFGVYVLGIGVLSLVIIALPEPPRIRDALRSQTRLPLAVYGVSALQLVLMLGFYVVPTDMAMFMQSEQIGGSGAAGLAFSALTLSSFLAGLAYSWAGRQLHSWALVAGAALVGGGFWLLGGSTSFTAVVLGMVVVGLGVGTTHPALLLATANLAPQSSSGQALSIFNSAMYAGQFLSPFVFRSLGLLVNASSARFSFRIAGVAFAVAALVASMVITARKERRDSL